MSGAERIAVERCDECLERPARYYDVDGQYCALCMDEIEARVYFGATTAEAFGTEETPESTP